jgi:hypothetical protein
MTKLLELKKHLRPGGKTLRNGRALSIAISGN